MDYDKYQLSAKEKGQFIFEVVLIDLAVSFLFYQSVWALLLGIPIGFIWYRQKKKYLINEKKKKLSVQFRDGILAVAAALKVGYSVEKAFEESEKDLRMNYPPDADIIMEFQIINMQVKNNVVLEQLLLDFAKRSHINDIYDFVEVFAIAKRRGGDFGKIIKNTADIISEKIEVYQEIETFLTAKQFEQRIMSVVPLLIILYIRLTSPHFMDVMYHNLPGISVMTICLVVYCAAFFLAERITNIEI